MQIQKWSIPNLVHPKQQVSLSVTLKNDKPDNIQLKYNIWDPPDYLYDTCSDHEGLDDGSSTGSPYKTTINPYTSGFEQSDVDSGDFDFEDWVNEQFRICKAIQNSYQYDDKKQ